MNRQILAAMLLSFLAPGFCMAQNAFLEGKIIDSKSRQPLTSVNIVAGENIGATSDQNGYYRLALPPGKQTIFFEYIGYKTHQTLIEIAANQTIILNVSLTEIYILSETVVVSAGKFEQNLAEITVSMEVLKPALIENRNTTGLSQILQQTPGVSIVDSEPQIRSGSGFSFGAGSRVMVLIDDLPILSGDAGRPSWGFMPIENVEQVEVIKGASSVLYGSSALNGVINLRTAYPRSKPRTKLILYSGIYSDPKTKGAKYWEITPTFNGASFLHSRIMGNLDFIIGGNYLGDQGHLGIPVPDSLGDRSNSDVKGRFNVNLRYRPPKIPGFDFGLNTNYQKSESISTLLWANADSGLYQPLAGAATRTNQNVLTLDPFINYLFPNGTKLSLKGRYFKLDNDNTNNQGNFSKVYYGEFQFQQQFDSLGIKDFTLTAGLVRIRTEGNAELFAQNPDSSGKNTANNFSGYLQLDKKFFNRLTASTGIRFERFDLNGEEEDKTIFRTGLNLRLGSSTYFRGSFGQGFRFPTVGEKYVRTVVGGIGIFPNRELKSETGWNAEGGIKQGFRIKNFSGFFDAAYFHQEYDNFIEFTFGQWGTFQDPLFGLGFKSLNTGKSKVTGLDLSLSGEGKIGGIIIRTLSGYTYSKPVTLTPGFEYGISKSGPVNYLNTSSDTTGNILKYRMQHLVRSDVEFSYHKWQWGTSFRYNSFMKNIDQVFLSLDETGLLPTGIIRWREENDGGDLIVDARLGYNINPENRIAVIIKNLFNREYAIRPLKLEKNRTITFQYVLTL